MHRLGIIALSLFVVVVRNSKLIFNIICKNDNRLGIKNISNLVANRIVDTLHIELGSESGLYAINNGEFRIALFSLFEQTLGLIEKTSIFEGDTHAVGKCLQQP